MFEDMMKLVKKYLKGWDMHDVKFTAKKGAEFIDQLTGIEAMLLSNNYTNKLRIKVK